MIWPRIASFDGGDGTKSAPTSACAGNTLSPCRISRPTSTTRMCVSGSSRRILRIESLPGTTAPVDWITAVVPA